MATYPIKMLKDEQGTPFVPLVSTQAVRNPDGQTVEDILDSKLSPTNIKEGENIVVTVSGNDVTITADVPDTTVLVDNLNQTTAGVGALDARQGNVLLNTVNAKAVPTGGNAGQVLKKRTNDDNDLEWGDAADPNAISGDGSIKKIIEISYEDYQALQTIDPDTEYHIIESGSTGSIEYEIRRIIREMDEAKHPIGSLEFNTSGTNPSVYLGFGTWELWGAGKVPIGVDSSDSSIDDADKTVGSKTKSYTPAGTNTGTAITMNAVELTHSGGAVGNHTLTGAESGVQAHSHGMQNAGNHNHGLPWDGYSIGSGSQFKYVVTGGGGNHNVYSDDGGSHSHTIDNATAKSATSGHNHGFTQPNKHSFTPTTKTVTQPTFTGTQTNINVVQPSISCYMWKRTA